MKNIKTRVKRILRDINLDQEVINYYIDMITYCNKNKIHILDINLTRDMYPMLSKTYDLTPESIEKKMLIALKRSYKETDNLMYYNTLGYSKKISIKKLLVVLILKLQDENYRA